MKMAKADQEAFNIIVALVNKGQVIQIEQKFGGVEVTVWPNQHDQLNHSHYQGATLLEAISKLEV